LYSLNGRSQVTRSALYDLVHPLFLNSMGELGTERRVEAIIENNPRTLEVELMEKNKTSTASRRINSA
jgi:hypothetical protein